MNSNGKSRKRRSRAYKLKEFFRKQAGQRFLLPLFEQLESRLVLAGLYNDRAAFTGDPSVGFTAKINFDNYPAGANFTNRTEIGVKFEAPGSGPLLVMPGSPGIRNPLSPSSGANVLSPGGSDLISENDDLTLVFNVPVQAAGLDVVFDVPDGQSFVSVTFKDASGNTLATQNPISAPNGSPGYQFVGYVSSASNIKSIVIDEFDPSSNDDHVAYDSIVFSAQQRETEPNTDLVTATALPLFEDPAGSGFFTSSIALGVIDPASESDYWSFAAQQGDKLIIDMTTVSGSLIPRFLVRNAAGSSLLDSTSWNDFGTPWKTTNQVYTIPVTGTYFVQTLHNTNYGGNNTGSYQFRVDLGRGVQLEPYDFNFYNNTLSQAANYPLSFQAGAAGHLLASVAGSLYSQEGLDYFPLGRLDPGNQVTVSSRTISVSGLTYKVQVVGATVGLLPDADGSQLDARASVAIALTDDYYLKVEAINGVGIRGQYLVDVDVQDTVPPKITTISQLPAAGGTEGLILNPITVSFSEDLQTSLSGAAGTWDLRASGADGQFDTGDDVAGG